MLERIRQALGHGTGPERPASEAATRLETGADSGLEAALPPIPPEELVQRFEAETQKVGGACYRASTPAELEAITSTILKASGATSVVLSRSPLLRDLGLAERLRRAGLSVAVYSGLGPSPEPSASRAEHAAPGVQSPLDPTAISAEDLFREQCFSAAVGITGVDFALAESGSLVLTSVTEGSQLASLAPPVHIALYRRQQVVASLEEVLEALPIARSADAPNPGRSVVFVTGPSRTADIEQILIRGVHGPREVHAILVEDSCLT